MIQIELLSPVAVADFRTFVCLLAEAFETPHFELLSEEKATKILARPDFRAFVAKKENLILGGLTLYLLEDCYHNQDKKLAYLYDIAVVEKHRGKGIGSKLLDFTKSYLKKENISEIFVQAEADDQDAIAFYRKHLTKRKDVELGVAYFSFAL
ncbi:GNAT family N-acetyltransferase [Hugenholtzia roseola]|uniref:GNAT family N-acetyltransferase n=1 Tax=Hugenholtzia roseola TaxID=1002 RepID=UPI0004038C1B|nr:GNAT family N-acetyltransferase [Hugenholtzia roseola]